MRPVAVQDAVFLDDQYCINLAVKPAPAVQGIHTQYMPVPYMTGQIVQALRSRAGQVDLIQAPSRSDGTVR